MPYQSKTEHLPFITDGVEAYNQLSPERMEMLLHDLPGIAYRCRNDANWTMLFISEGCREIFGYAPEALLYNSEMSYDELIFEEDRPLVRAAVNRGVKENQLYRMEYRILHKDGSIRWVWEQGRAVPAAKGKPKYLDGLILDISYRKELQAILQQRADELKELNLMKDRFFTAIIHNLQGPVFSFISLSDFMRLNFDGLSKDELLDSLSQMTESARRMEQLLENLNNWALAAGDKLKLQPSHFRMHRLVEDSLLGLQDQISRKSLSLETDIPKTIKLKTDMQLFLIMMRNLISNAIKFSKTKGKILIAAQETEQEIQISISDEGVGIPRKEIPNLFRLDREYLELGTQDEVGTGIGLLLVKEILDRIGGDIKIQSRVNRGTKVMVSINK